MLTYSEQHLVQYAYRLEGFDRDWQYTDGLTHCAVFHYTPSGTYQLYLRAADRYGHWYDLPYTIQVHVLAPWYATWWAYLIYSSMAVLLFLLLWHYRQMQRELQASRRFSTILQSTRIAMEPHKLASPTEKTLRRCLLPFSGRMPSSWLVRLSWFVVIWTIPIITATAWLPILV